METVKGPWLRNDCGQVSKIDGKSFCILNNRGYGDALASLSLASELSRRGARSISVGLAYHQDMSLFTAFPDVEYFFQMVPGWQALPHASFYYGRADCVIDQRRYEWREGVSFYESRWINAGVEFGSNSNFRPKILIPQESRKFADDFLKSNGLKDGEFFIVHPQANHSSRSLTRETAIATALDRPLRCIVVGKNYYALDGIPTKQFITFSKRHPMIQTAALIERCAGFIGVCSVWSHVAFAMDKPCFVFYSDTKPEHIFGKHHKDLGFHQSPSGIRTGISVKDYAALDDWSTAHHWG